MCSVNKCSVCRLKQYERGIFTDGLTFQDLVRLKSAVESILNLGIRDTKIIGLHAEVTERIKEISRSSLVLN